MVEDEEKVKFLSQERFGDFRASGSIHLGAKILAEDPNVDGERRVIFLSSDDQGAANKVAKLVERLGFAPVWLGRLTEGGLLVHARGNTWGPLIFQDLFKKQEKAAEPRDLA
jgi:predicted dinucleotide-binding enzyme